MNAGTPTAISATVGAANKPIYLNAGTPTAASGNIGAALTPIYMLNGVFTPCSQALGAASNGGIIAASLAANGYVKFANGLILQWGMATSTTVIFPISFGTVYQAYTIVNSTSTGDDVTDAANFQIRNLSATKFDNNWSSARWLAIGKA